MTFDMTPTILMVPGLRDFVAETAHGSLGAAT
jgi:hypothetical protein